MAEINNAKTNPFNKGETKPGVNPTNKDLNLEKEQVVKDNIVKDLKPRTELTIEELKLLEQLPFKLEIRKSRDGKSTYPVITTAIDVDYFPNVVIRNGQKSIDMPMFKSILLKTNSEFRTKNGNAIESWDFKFPVRYVKGYVKNLNGEVFPYYSIEIFVTTKTSFTHFFSGSERNLLLDLEKYNKCPIKFITRVKLAQEIEVDNGKAQLIIET